MDALTIATVCHAGQVDKAGVPYIEHPVAVANSIDLSEVKALDGFHPEMFAWAIEAAVLHDVIEDTSMTPAGLIELGIDPAVVRTVLLLTYDKKVQSRDDYYTAIKADPLARIVKIADVKHNLGRLGYLNPDDRVRLTTKYTHALEMLS